MSTWPPYGATRAGERTSLNTDRWTHLISTIGAWVRGEAGPGRLLPWVPVAFGAGIAVYFAAEREPVASVTAVVAAALCMGAFVARKHRSFAAMVLCAAFAVGFAAATLKTARIAHTVLAGPVFSVAIKGFVETREERERTDRFILRVEEMDAPAVRPNSSVCD